MPLPNEDPSNPALPAPIFADVDAVRGDQLRANNQLIYENFDYLNDGGNLNDATAKNPPVDADTLPLSDSADSGIVKKLTFANLFLWVISKIAALATKSTPVDADGVLLIDSAASNVGKFWSWANIKAALKSYFDPLYVPKYAKLTHTTSSATSGGTFSSGSFQAAPLNTEDSDADGIVTLSGNAFTLQAGTYQFRALSLAYAVNFHQAKLRNTTDGTDVILGTSEFANQTYTMSNHSVIAGKFTIAGEKTFEIQHQCSTTRSTDGFGLAASFGVNNVFRVAEIWKVA